MTRKKQVEDDVASTPSVGASVVSFASKIPDDSVYVLNPLRVDQEKADLLVSLTHIFGQADWAEDLIEEVEGDGLAFLAKVNERGRKASVKSRVAAQTAFDRHKAKGVTGEITLASFDAFVKEYRRLKRTLDPAIATALGGESEAAMINAIALKDPSLRELYEIKIELSPPSTLGEAVEMPGSAPLEFH